MQTSPLRLDRIRPSMSSACTSSMGSSATIKSVSLIQRGDVLYSKEGGSIAKNVKWACLPVDRIGLGKKLAPAGAAPAPAPTSATAK